MEKTIKCAECGKECTYNVPIGRTDNRKYCFECSEAKKAQWEAKEATQQAPKQNVPEFKPASSLADERSKSIVAQCLTKVTYGGAEGMLTPKDVLETYNYFINEL
jgi:hypothetical protein